jgi:hypothetical protein
MLRLTKGVRPAIPLAERMEIVSHICDVDHMHAEVVDFPSTMSTSSTVLLRARAALHGGGERVSG